MKFVDRECFFKDVVSLIIWPEYQVPQPSFTYSYLARVNPLGFSLLAQGETELTNWMSLFKSSRIPAGPFSLANFIGNERVRKRKRDVE